MRESRSIEASVPSCSGGSRIRGAVRFETATARQPSDLIGSDSSLSLGMLDIEAKNKAALARKTYVPQSLNLEPSLLILVKAGES